MLLAGDLGSLDNPQKDDVSAGIAGYSTAGVKFITEIIYETCQENIQNLLNKIFIIDFNPNLYSLVNKDIEDNKTRLNTLNGHLGTLKNQEKNKDSLLAMAEEITKLSKLIWTDDVRFEVEFSRLKNIVSKQGLNSVFARFLNPKNAKIFRDNIAHIEDLQFRRKINKAQMAKILELTNNYLENTDTRTRHEHALNEYINTLPANSHIKFYLKALIISLICTALITGVIVLSIYNPTVANLMAPVYQATGEFFANLLAAFAPMAKIISAIVTTSEKTVFVMPGIIPYIGDAPIPVWSLVAGAVVGSVTGIKIGHVIADRKFGDNKKNVKDLENTVRNELSEIADPSDPIISLLLGGSMFSGQRGEPGEGDGYEYEYEDPGHGLN